MGIADDPPSAAAATGRKEKTKKTELEPPHPHDSSVDKTESVSG